MPKRGSSVDLELRHEHDFGPRGSRLPGAAPPGTANSVGRQRIKVARYVAISAAVSVGVAVAADHLPPETLGFGLFAVLSLIGLNVLRQRRRSSRRYPIATLRRELDQTRRSYRQLFSAVPCFICVLDREHRILEANDLYRRAFGASDRSLCYEVCKQRRTPCLNCLVDKTFEDGAVRSSEETLVTREGRRVSAVVYTQPVFDDHGNISSVMEVFTDITEVKRLQRQLALTGRAVASMAHRVKNILMGLEGGIFVVNTGLETEDRPAIDEGWEMVQRNVGLVSRIVRDLLYCSKDREPEFRPGVDPREVVREVERLFTSRVAGEGIRLRLEIDEANVTGTFDPDGLHNLLCNLVANAIDACRFDPAPEKDGHRITLRCRPEGDGGVVLEVEDDGAGIPEELNGKVFEDFFSSKGTEGTGIGLLVVQKVAEEHGGRVSFTSSPGEGTTFTVVLPREPTARRVSPPVPISSSRLPDREPSLDGGTTAAGSMPPP